jgi:hypothetical protein
LTRSDIERAGILPPADQSRPRLAAAMLLQEGRTGVEMAFSEDRVREIMAEG